MKPTLIFVYNADSGLFNAITDMAHKIFSPHTYSCQLCSLTHSHVGMRKEWKQFIETLELPVQFLHANELAARYSVEGLSLPVVLIREGESIEILVEADVINGCQDMDDLKEIIEDKLRS
jgi:acyl CoA:acetate/3-ketoacid CoA transferase alpha subunit